MLLYFYRSFASSNLSYIHNFPHFYLSSIFSPLPSIFLPISLLSIFVTPWPLLRLVLVDPGGRVQVHVGEVDVHDVEQALVPVLRLLLSLLVQRVAVTAVGARPRALRSAKGEQSETVTRPKTLGV